MKKLVLLTLILSCMKSFKVIDLKYKTIDENLVIAVNNNRNNTAIKLINEGANINYVSEGLSILDLAIIKKNLRIIKVLLKRDVKVSKDNVLKIYDIALDNSNFNMIDLMKDRYKLEEDLIDKNKYFLYLCYASNEQEVERFIERNDINPEDKNSKNALIILAESNKINVFKMLIEKYNFDINYENDHGATVLIAGCNNNNKELIDFIIKRKADINKINNKGLTALMKASEKGYIEIVKALIEAGAKVTKEKIRENEITPLMLAIQNGHVEVVRTLIRAAAEIYKRSKDLQRVLLEVVKKGYKEVAEALIEEGTNIRENFCQRFYSECRPLVPVSKNGHLEILKLLLEKGVYYINQTDVKGNTALLCAAKHGHLEIVKLLLEKGANFNANYNGNTPLSYAARNGHLEIVKLLLEKGADFKIENYDEIGEHNGNTSLLYAAKNRHLEIVKLLLEKGADIDDEGANIDGEDSEDENSEENCENYQNYEVYTALMYALKNNDIKMVKLLIENGANIDIITSNGKTALMIAVQNKYKEMIELLLKNGANVNVKNKNDVTALMIATENGHLEIVQLLLEAGADANDKAKEKWADTALMIASQNRHKEIIELLLKNGADVNAKNHQGLTALMIVVEVTYMKDIGSFLDIINLLLKNGADVGYKGYDGRTILEFIFDKIKNRQLLNEEKAKYINIGYALIGGIRGQLSDLSFTSDDFNNVDIEKANEYTKKAIELFDFLLYEIPLELFVNIINYTN